MAHPFNPPFTFESPEFRQLHALMCNVYPSWAELCMPLQMVGVPINRVDQSGPMYAIMQSALTVAAELGLIQRIIGIAIADPGKLGYRRQFQALLGEAAPNAEDWSDLPARAKAAGLVAVRVDPAPRRQEVARLLSKADWLGTPPSPPRPHFLDSLPFDWTVPQASRLVELLVALFPTPEEANGLIRQVDLQPYDVEFHAVQRLYWHSIIDAATSMGVLRKIIRLAVQDSTKSPVLRDQLETLCH